jgi:hypothetical protein
MVRIPYKFCITIEAVVGFAYENDPCCCF